MCDHDHDDDETASLAETALAETAIAETPERRPTSPKPASPKPASPKVAPEVAVPLVENHRAFLAFLERRLGDRALAEDLLQDAFVRSIDKAGALRDREAIVPWFYRVLRNAIVDHQRRRATTSKALTELAAELETERAGTDTHGVVCQCVKELAATLKPEYAEALRRIEIDGVAVKDYADEVGITKNNAGVRVFRARDALRKQIERSCGTCATHGCVDCTCATE